MTAMAARHHAFPTSGDFKDVEVIDVLVKAGRQDRRRYAAASRSKPRRRRWMCRRPAAGVVKCGRAEEGRSRFEGQRDRADGSGAAVAAGSSAETAAAPASAPTAARRQRHLQTAPKPKQPEPQTPAASRRTGDRILHRRQPHRQPHLPLSTKPASRRAHASPSVRKFARELGVDLGRVKGTRHQGPHHARRRQGLGQAGADSRARRSGWRRAAEESRKSISRSSARSRSSRSAASRRFPVRACRRAGSTCRTSGRWTKRTSPISKKRATSSRARRAKEGIKLTPLAFILRACVKALQEFPHGQQLARCHRARTWS